jgi:hypothetical protein
MVIRVHFHFKDTHCVIFNDKTQNSSVNINATLTIGSTTGAKAASSTPPTKSSWLDRPDFT